ncbi:MAG TPA: hypothetical protein VIL36_09745 [Acidimicrobiales bacterium]
MARAGRVGRAPLRSALVVLVVLALPPGLLAGCGDDAHRAGGDAAGGAADRLRASTTTSEDDDGPDCDVDGEVTDGAVEPVATLDVTLSDFAFSLSRPSVPAGPVELVARNIGLIPHEVTVLRYDGDPGDLPRNPVGGADTSVLPDGAEVGRIWSFEPDVTCRAVFDLTPGRYALLCNVVDDGTNPHYAAGMHTGLEVVAAPPAALAGP